MGLSKSLINLSSLERNDNSFSLTSEIFDRMSDPVLLISQTDIPISNSICYDYSFAENNGIFKNTDEEDRVNVGTVYGLNLNGTDEYIEFTNSPEFTFGRMTVGAVINLTSGAKQSIITKMDENTPLREWEFFIDSANKLNLNLWDESSNGYQNIKSDLALSEGYHYVSATWNGKSNVQFEVILYIDGIAISKTDTLTGTFGGMTNLPTPVRVGAIVGTGGTLSDFWDGELGVIFLDGVKWSAIDIWSLWLKLKGKYNL